MTFIKDKDSQILYVTEPKSSDIFRFEMHNEKCQICADTDGVKQRAFQRPSVLTVDTDARTSKVAKPEVTKQPTPTEVD